jgi:hypothetical protein
VAVVVLRDGTRYSLTKPYEIRGTQARLSLTTGFLVAVRASEIDEEASKRATDAANAPPAPTPTPTVPSLTTAAGGSRVVLESVAPAPRDVAPPVERPTPSPTVNVWAFVAPTPTEPPEIPTPTSVPPPSESGGGVDYLLFAAGVSAVVTIGGFIYFANRRRTQDRPFQSINVLPVAEPSRVLKLRSGGVTPIGALGIGFGLIVFTLGSFIGWNVLTMAIGAAFVAAGASLKRKLPAKLCPSCRMEVPLEATVCGHCQRDIPA